jgi:RHS repeat-associated protein
VGEWTWPLGTTTYGYDQAGNLVSVQRPEAGENPAIEESLAYDAGGLLTAKTIGASTRHLAWDASTNLPLLLNDGETNYLYGPGGLPIEQINSKEEPTYLHHDQLGSTRLLTGSGGATAAAQSFAPYGTLEAKTGTATTPLGYAGQYTDGETGLQYLRARFYDPGTGQFLSRDPLADLTRQPYSYALDSPLNWIDPSGLEGSQYAISGCVAGEAVDPAGGCLGGVAIGGGEELVNLAGGAILSWMASESSSSDEESSSEDENDCEPYPWNLEKKIGVPSQEMDIARREVSIDELGRDTNPETPGPGGFSPSKGGKGRCTLSDAL